MTIINLAAARSAREDEAQRGAEDAALAAAEAAALAGNEATAAGLAEVERRLGFEVAADGLWFAWRDLAERLAREHGATLADLKERLAELKVFHPAPSPVAMPAGMVAAARAYSRPGGFRWEVDAETAEDARPLLAALVAAGADAGEVAIRLRPPA